MKSVLHSANKIKKCAFFCQPALFKNQNRLWKMEPLFNQLPNNQNLTHSVTYWSATHPSQQIVIEDSQNTLLNQRNHQQKNVEQGSCFQKGQLQALIKDKIYNSIIQEQLLTIQKAESQQKLHCQDNQFDSLQKQILIENYQHALNEQSKLKRIEGMIGKLIKLKKEQSQSCHFSSQCSDKSFLLKSRQSQLQDDDGQDKKSIDSEFIDTMLDGQVMLEDEDEHSEAQAHFLQPSQASTILQFAKAVRLNIPNYPLANAVCSLNRYAEQKNLLQGIDQLSFPTKSAGLNGKSYQQQNYKTAEITRTLSKTKRSKQGDRFPLSKKKMQFQRPFNCQPNLNITRILDKSRFTDKNQTSQRVPNLGNCSLQGEKPAAKLSMREERQKDVALLFITKGYGLSMAKEFTKNQLDGNKYNSLMSSIIRGSVRKLCDIMTKNLLLKVKVFDPVQQRLLRSPLVNCRKWLSNTQQQTFYKIIKIVYGMNDEPIYNDEVVSLYEKVLRQLNKRSENGLEKPGKKIRAQVEPSTMQVKPLNGKFQSVSAPPSLLQSTNIHPNSPNLQKLPTHQRKAQQTQPPSIKKTNTPNIQSFQKQIAQLFAEFKSFESVYLMLKKRHPNFIWQKIQVKTTLDKLIKIGLKKIMKYRRDYTNQGMTMPSLALSENLVSQIINSAVGYQTRVGAVQCLLQNILTSQNTIQLINIVNSCLYELSTKKK